MKIIAKCSEEEKEKVLKARNYILSRNKNIIETSSSSKILYGKGNKNFIAEIRFDLKRNRMALFIWLPIVAKRYSIGRMRIWTNWEVITDIGHVTKGLGSMITWQEEKSKILSPKKRYTVNPSRKSAIAMSFNLYKTWLKNRQCIQAYNEIKYRSNSLEEIIDYAIEIWQRRI